MKYLILFLSITLLSCSPRWYAKQCAKRFPINESVNESIKYAPGIIEPTTTPPIPINCDSIIKAQKALAAKDSTQYVPQLILVPCPPSTHQVDTVFRDKTITKKDSAGLYLLHYTIDSLNKQCSKKDSKAIEQSEKITAQEDTIRKQRYDIIKLILLVLAISAFILYSTFKR